MKNLAKSRVCVMGSSQALNPHVVDGGLSDIMCKLPIQHKSGADLGTCHGQDRPHDEVWLYVRSKVWDCRQCPGPLKWGDQCVSTYAVYGGRGVDGGKGTHDVAITGRGPWRTYEALGKGVLPACD